MRALDPTLIDQLAARVGVVMEAGLATALGAGRPTKSGRIGAVAVRSLSSGGDVLVTFDLGPCALTVLVGADRVGAEGVRGEPHALDAMVEQIACGWRHGDWELRWDPNVGVAA